MAYWCWKTTTEGLLWVAKQILKRVRYAALWEVSTIQTTCCRLTERLNLAVAVACVDSYVFSITCTRTLLWFPVVFTVVYCRYS